MLGNNCQTAGWLSRLRFKKKLPVARRKGVWLPLRRLPCRTEDYVPHCCPGSRHAVRKAPAAGSNPGRGLVPLAGLNGANEPQD